MTSVPPRRAPRDEPGDGRGFSTFEVLNAGVILAIVTVTMVFAFGGVTSRSALADCQQKGSTVATAILKYDAANPDVPLTNANFLGRLTSTSANGGPFLASWPSDFPHYAFTVVNGTLWVFTGNSLTATTPPVATPLGGPDFAPGALNRVSVTDSTSNWINYDTYGPNACAGVQ